MNKQLPKPDILIFLSDQHTPLYAKPWGGPALTPNIQRLIDTGFHFSQAYTSCPLCVPARMSMLSGLFPSETGILTNNAALPNITPTFLHTLTAAGYETVLIGRMHFIGPDQRHGFTKRLCGDITPTTFIRPESVLERERGIFAGAFDMPGSIDLAGGGTSPVLIYDREITEAALQYMRGSYEKPQCIVVGTYAPHFPYVAPPELYQKYKEFVTLPPHFHTEEVLNPPLSRRQKRVSQQACLSALASYCGMIENMDRQLGSVYDQFIQFTNRRHTRRLFCYLSDHGDQVGDRDLYGKFTFFEKSSRIPLILWGDGIPQGRSSNAPVSIMDIGPTLCEYSHTTPLLRQNGISLIPYMNQNETEERIVISEIIEPNEKSYTYGRMYRYKHYKYITYNNYTAFDMLYDLGADPSESNNIAGNMPELINFFNKQGAKYLKSASRIEKEQNAYEQAFSLMVEYERQVGAIIDERRSIIPETYWTPPQS